MDVPHDAPPANRPRPPRGRLLGLDAVRALAIVGMVYMHVSPTGWLAPAPMPEKPAVLDWVEHAVSGRSMSLFVLMAGISVALMTGGPAPLDGERLTTARRRLAIRAAMLLLISLCVDQLSGMNLSILEFYAVWLLLLIPLVRLRPGTLMAAAGALGAALPVFCFVVLNYGRTWAISPMNPAGAEPAFGLTLLLSPQDWLAKLHQLLMGGGFQTPYAIPLLLAGLAIGRLDLRSPAVRAKMAGWGALLVAVSWLVSWVALVPLGAERALAAMMESAGGPMLQPWASVLTLPPHQLYALSIPMAPMMTGVALLLLAGLLTLLERPGWQVALRPLTAAGSLALTWYAAHQVFIERVAGDPPYAFTLFAGMAVFAFAVSPLWLRWMRRGPLEWLVHRVIVMVVPDRPVPDRAGARHKAGW
ncbi:DUF418 domain-containing protein [Nonomuraea sp. B10E15]|uniref:heparan-alpha-glucosaminide N-acetyltransferase domain-containing protein n=1 Tax=Nonomuraea sp. B10E15 TaxID=3153560 RepID=UPI00325D4D18